MKKFNCVASFLFLCLGAGGFFVANQMKAKISADNLGPAFWPKYLCIAIMLISLLLLLESIFFHKKNDTPAPIRFKSKEFRRVATLSGIMIAFVLLIYFLGIYVGILFMMVACSFVLGERNIKMIVAIPVISCVFIYVVFGVGLGVPLPTGLFFG
ncbi:MAG: tripartite tricarboxylate transporter TctB family protein [Oscillospiraceae bacterium]